MKFKRNIYYLILVGISLQSQTIKIIGFVFTKLSLSCRNMSLQSILNIINIESQTKKLNSQKTPTPTTTKIQTHIPH